MNKKSFSEKIFELSEQFNRYVFEHPEVLDGIPDKAVLVVLHVDDPEFNRANIDLAEATPLPAGSQRVHVRMKRQVRTIQQIHWEADIQAPQLA
ncbi:MAG: hypothetical protein KDI55_25050 [Anaerolineae bacterium]|nr:hypothetical protein [Anaerolineae bacterium]